MGHGFKKCKPTNEGCQTLINKYSEDLNDVNPSVFCLSVYLFVCLPVYLFTCLPVYLFTCLSISG